MSELVGHLRAIGFGQRSNEVQLLALFVSVDRRPLVVVHQLVKGVELALPDAVHVLLYMNPEMLIAAWSFQ